MKFEKLKETISKRVIMCNYPKELKELLENAWIEVKKLK